MTNFKDLTGQKFGRLTVVEKVGIDKHHNVLWKCQCDCGNIINVSTSQLRRNKTKSCGCLRIEVLSMYALKHGKSDTRLYKIWSGIKQRCYNSNDNEYYAYGGRGISVCEEWLKFEPFYEWAVNNGYSNDLSIDRIDNDGNYEPNNCRWATIKEQNRNTRRNHYITYKGETKTIAEWAEEYNMPNLRLRLSRKWSMEKALTTPIKKEKNND